jgi:hypothetical protein
MSSIFFLLARLSLVNTLFLVKSQMKMWTRDGTESFHTKGLQGRPEIIEARCKIRVGGPLCFLWKKFYLPPSTIAKVQSPPSIMKLNMRTHKTNKIICFFLWLYWMAVLSTWCTCGDEKSAHHPFLNKQNQKYTI